jgi:hypothetical protein
LDKRLGGHQIRSGSSGEEKYPMVLLGIENFVGVLLATNALFIRHIKC